MQKVYPDIQNTFYSNPSVDKTKQFQKSETPSQPIQCRICLEQQGQFITPCQCIGSVRFIHKNCLIKWSKQVIRKRLQKLDEEHQEQQQNVGDNEITCELCKSIITLKVKWQLKRLNSQQICDKIQDETTLFLIYLSIILISIFCFSFLVYKMLDEPTEQHQEVDEASFMWIAMVICSIFCIAFLGKGIYELAIFFYKWEFEVNDVQTKNNDKENNQNNDTNQHKHKHKHHQSRIANNNNHNLQEQFRTDHIQQTQVNGLKINSLMKFEKKVIPLGIKTNNSIIFEEHSACNLGNMNPIKRKQQNNYQQEGHIADQDMQGVLRSCAKRREKRKQSKKKLLGNIQLPPIALSEDK